MVAVPLDGITVFGNSSFNDPLVPIKAVRRFNEFAAEVTARHPDRLLGLASTNPFGGDEFLREAEQAVTQVGLRGFMVNTSVELQYLDSPRAFPFFDLACRLDVPVFLHPPRDTIGNEMMEIKRLPEMVGRPFDTTLTLARMAAHTDSPSAPPTAISPGFRTSAGRIRYPPEPSTRFRDAW